VDLSAIGNAPIIGGFRGEGKAPMEQKNTSRKEIRVQGLVGRSRSCSKTDAGKKVRCTI
jgi:hypothetical protein